MKAGKVNQAPAVNSANRESNNSGKHHHNKDQIGSHSGPMGAEDARRDKYGSRHNQDAQGLQSPATTQVRDEMGLVRTAQKRRSRTGSRK